MTIARCFLQFFKCDIRSRNENTTSPPPLNQRTFTFLTKYSLKNINIEPFKKNYLPELISPDRFFPLGGKKNFH